MLGAMELGIANDGERAVHEQAAQIAVTLFADTAEPVLATARVLLRHEPDPGREIAPRSERLWISDASDQSGGQRRTDAGNVIKPLARLVGPVPGDDHTVELQDLRLKRPQLSAERGETRAGDRGHPFVTWIGDHPKQLLDTIASDRRDDPELCKMGADRIDHRSLLADQQMARAMEHQAALLLGRLGRHEPHGCPGDRFADRFGISGVVLLSLDVRLHVGRRHQAHRVSERLELARPMMRGGTGLNTNEARRQLLKECQDVAALQLPADNNVASCINAVNLKTRLGDVETDCRNRLHVWLLRIVGALTATTSMALMCRWRSRPQHQNRTKTSPGIGGYRAMAS